MSPPIIPSLEDIWTRVAFTDVLHILQASYLKLGTGNSGGKNPHVGQGASSLELMPVEAVRGNEEHRPVGKCLSLLTP